MPAAESIRELIVQGTNEGLAAEPGDALMLHGTVVQDHEPVDVDELQPALEVLRAKCRARRHKRVNQKLRLPCGSPELRDSWAVSAHPGWSAAPDDAVTGLAGGWGRRRRAGLRRAFARRIKAGGAAAV